jgi:hypothetical protein
MFDNLNAEMARFKVDKPTLAEILKIALPTLYEKLSTGRITCLEARTIRDYFNENFGTNFTIDYLFSLEPVAV